MNTYSRDDLLALAASYALGATTAEETAAIDAALPEWPELAAEVASFREVVAELAQIPPSAPVVPTPAVRDRLLQRIHRPPVTMSSTGRKIEAPRPRSSMLRAPIVAAAAAIVLLAGVGVFARRAVVAEKQRSELASKLAHREETLNTMLHAEKDLRVIHLKAADTVRGPGIQFYWNEKHATGIVHAFRLPPAPPQRAYQVWMIVDGQPRSVKVFNSDPDGHALAEQVTVPTTARGATAMYVTLEPAGGSAAPTTEPFLKGSVSATY